MKLKLYQVFYKEGQDLDPDCIPVNACGVDVAPLYENYHILDLYPTLDGADYYGVTSWRMGEKTALTKQSIEAFIQENPGYNAYIYGQQGDDMALIKNKKHTSAIGVAWERLFELDLFKHQDIAWIEVFCNYWIADKKTWDRYIEHLKKTIHLLETDAFLVWLTTRITYPHRDIQYPLQPFILEYLFGLFLRDNPDIAYKVIPTCQDDPMILQKYRESHQESLSTIYKKYATEQPGQGDKGTLHHYIENYDRLLTPYRNTAKVMLEIGVAGGRSLKMWREYFKTARIIGIDIEMPKEPIYGCGVYIADQANKEQLDTVLSTTTLDVVIDDGSHRLEDQIASFKHLFPRLSKGGIYIIEDIQNPDTDIPALMEACGECEVLDTREESNRYDDILLVWRNV